MLIPIPFSHGNSTKSNSSQSGFDLGQWVHVKKVLMSEPSLPLAECVSVCLSVIQLMQECGDISEDVDAPPVLCQTENSLKLVTESSYDIPGLTFEIPKSPPQAAHPPLQSPSSSQLPPVEEAPPQHSTSPQPGHVTPSGSSGFTIGSGGGSAKVKGLKNLFAPKKVGDLLTDTHYTLERAHLSLVVEAYYIEIESGIIT